MQFEIIKSRRSLFHSSSSEVSHDIRKKKKKKKPHTCVLLLEESEPVSSVTLTCPLQRILLSAAVGSTTCSSGAACVSSDPLLCTRRKTRWVKVVVWGPEGQGFVSSHIKPGINSGLIMSGARCGWRRRRKERVFSPSLQQRASYGWKTEVTQSLWGKRVFFYQQWRGVLKKMNLIN